MIKEIWFSKMVTNQVKIKTFQNTIALLRFVGKRGTRSIDKRQFEDMN